MLTDALTQDWVVPGSVGAALIEAENAGDSVYDRLEAQATSGEVHRQHSVYRGHQIVKVTQGSGRVTYDALDPHGDIVVLGCHSLAVVRAEVTAEVGGY